MTAITITPNWTDKTARFKGTVAAGEHVSVTIENDGTVASADNLRLRVVGPNGATLAQFPMPQEILPSFEAPEEGEADAEREEEAPDAWDSDITPIRGTINLNTVQMLKAVPPGANVPLLWVLDDYENKTLYFKELFEVCHWPRIEGEEEPAPTNLDDYADRMEDFDTRLDAVEERVSVAEQSVGTAIQSANEATNVARTFGTSVSDALSIANDAKSVANEAKATANNANNSASAASEVAQAASATASTASSMALAAEETANDAKNVANEAKATANNANTAVSAANATAEAAATMANEAKSVADEAKAIAESIEPTARLAKYVVPALPAMVDADVNGIYFIPRQQGGEFDGYDEYTVVNKFGRLYWERIGGATVDTDGLASKEYVKDVLNYKPIEISKLTVSPTGAELGSTVTSATLTYTLNKAAASATLDGEAVTLSGASGTISLTGLSLKTNKTWTLEVTEAESPAADTAATVSKSVGLSFLNRVYWGAKAAPEQIDSAFIIGLGSSELSGSRARTKTVTAGEGQYIWFAYPVRLGAATFKVGGFDGGFTLVSDSFSYTNASGYTETYRVYRSDNAGLGATTVGVS